MINDRIDEFRSRRDGVVIPRIWVAVALSILLHLAALWELPPISVQLPKTSGDLDTPPTLSLRLAPPGPPLLPSQPAAPAQPRPAPEPAPRAPRAKAVPRPPPTPPVIALKEPKPEAPPVAPAPKSAPVVGDMASYIEARRRARGETAVNAQPQVTQVDEAEARRQRIIAGNLGSANQRTFGYDPNKSGGVFDIQSISLDYAEFLFYGWNKNVNRNTKQLIEVRRGNNSDIRIAVVRKMISIIREFENEDFLWESQRLGRYITLSARARDNSGLEAFMMNEFFPDRAAAQR